MNNRILAFAILASALSPIGALAQAPSLTIQVDHPTANRQPNALWAHDRRDQLLLRRRPLSRAVRDRVLSRSWDALRLWPMVARGDSIVNVSADESDGPSAAIPRSLRVTVDQSQRSLASRGRERWVLGHSCAAAHRVLRLFLRQDRQPRNFCHHHSAKRSNRRGCRIGHRHRPYRRMEALHIHSQDRRCACLVEQPSHPHDRSAGNESGSISSRSFRPPTTTGPAEIAPTS